MRRQMESRSCANGTFGSFYKKYGEKTEWNIPPYLFGIGEKGAHQRPYVGNTVEEDHAVDVGGVRSVPDPVHDVEVGRQADQVGNTDAQDVRQVPLLVWCQNHVRFFDFESGVVPGKRCNFLRQVFVH